MSVSGRLAMAQNCWDWPALNLPRSMTIASVGPSTASLTLTSRRWHQGRRPRCARIRRSLDQLHNDSTTITFHGDYDSAERERTLRGRFHLAVTWGHNKGHRPDLKQLPYILTVTSNGAVPVQNCTSRAATPPTTVPTRGRGSCSAS